MCVTDRISDFLTRIRNAKDVGHKYVDVPFSKIHEGMSKVLVEEGYIYRYISDAKRYRMRIFLKYYSARKSVINGLKRISKPGMRVYTGRKKSPKVLSGLGIAILSTSAGILEGKKAATKGMGGEVLCYVW